MQLEKIMEYGRIKWRLKNACECRGAFAPLIIFLFHMYIIEPNKSKHNNFIHMEEDDNNDRNRYHSDTAGNRNHLRVIFIITYRMSEKQYGLLCFELFMIMEQASNHKM